MIRYMLTELGGSATPRVPVERRDAAASHLMPVEAVAPPQREQGQESQEGAEGSESQEEHAGSESQEEDEGNVVGVDYPSDDDPPAGEHPSDFDIEQPPSDVQEPPSDDSDTGGQPHPRSRDPSDRTTHGAGPPSADGDREPPPDVERGGEDSSPFEPSSDDDGSSRGHRVLRRRNGEEVSWQAESYESAGAATSPWHPDSIAARLNADEELNEFLRLATDEEAEAATFSADDEPSEPSEPENDEEEEGVTGDKGRREPLRRLRLDGQPAEVPTTICVWNYTHQSQAAPHAGKTSKQEQVSQPTTCMHVPEDNPN